MSGTILQPRTKAQGKPASRIAAVSLSGFCRTVPGGDEGRTWILCGSRGGYGLRASDALRVVGGTAGVYRAGTGDGTCAATQKSAKRRLKRRFPPPLFSHNEQFVQSIVTHLEGESEQGTAPGFSEEDPSSPRLAPIRPPLSREQMDAPHGGGSDRS